MIKSGILTNLIHSEATARKFGVNPTGHAGLGAKVSVSPDWLVIRNSEAEKNKSNPISIYTESTPNPSVLKFVSNKLIVEDSFEFNNIEEAQEMEFAKKLFEFSYIKSIYISKNFISITKYDIKNWDEVSLELRNFIKSYLENNKVISSGNKIEVVKNDLDETSKKIVSILDEYIKPAVASDGGNILFDSYDPQKKLVKVVLQGACSGCPSSTVTLKNGIENMLKEMLSEKVNSVEAING